MPITGNGPLAGGIELECLSNFDRGLDAELGLFEELLPPLDFQLFSEKFIGCFRRLEVRLAVKLELDIPVPRIGTLIYGHRDGLMKSWVSPPSPNFKIQIMDQSDAEVLALRLDLREML